MKYVKDRQEAYPKHIIQFFTGAMGLTYIFWFGAALTGQSRTDFPNIIWYLIGGLAPAIVAIFLISTIHSKDDLSEYWRKMVNFREIGVGWYLIILIYPLLTFVSLLLDNLLMGKSLQLAETNTILNDPLSYVAFAAIALIGVLGEEFGWRGYALRFMIRKNSIVISTLLLGAIWSLWHLPLFFLKDTYQMSLGLLNVPFFVYLLDTVLLSVIMSWIFIHTKQSTAAIILLHFVINVSPVDDLFEISVNTKVIRLVLMFILSVLIIRFDLMRWDQKEVIESPLLS